MPDIRSLKRCTPLKHLITGLFSLILFPLPVLAGDIQPTNVSASVGSITGMDDFFGCYFPDKLPSNVADYVDFSESCLLNDKDDVVSLDADILAMFNRLNALRAEYGLPALAWHPGAARAARLHAVDMMERDYFAHDSPEGYSGAERMRRIDRDEVFGASGENLAWYRDSVPVAYNKLTLQNQLEQSPSHFTAMVNDKYTHVGMSIVRRGSTYIAVQVFLQSFGQLDGDLPSELHSGQVFSLPAALGSVPVRGWALMSPKGRFISRGYDLSVEVPETEEQSAKLIVMGAKSPTSNLMLNGPSVDLD